MTNEERGCRGMCFEEDGTDRFTQGYCQQTPICKLVPCVNFEVCKVMVPEYFKEFQRGECSSCTTRVEGTLIIFRNSGAAEDIQCQRCASKAADLEYLKYGCGHPICKACFAGSYTFPEEQRIPLPLQEDFGFARPPRPEGVSDNEYNRIVEDARLAWEEAEPEDHEEWLEEWRDVRFENVHIHGVHYEPFDRCALCGDKRGMAVVGESAADAE